MRGLRSQAGLDRLGIPGKYLGNSATIGDGEYETFYLPDGKSFRRRAETLKPENYTALKQWEDKAKKGGLENIIYSISYDFINQPYICLRAFAKMPNKSVAGRGLNPQEKFENGLMGFVTIFTGILPLKFPVMKGLSPETSFQQYTKMTKGNYTGVTSEKRFKAMWNDLKRDKFFLETNSKNDFDNMKKSIQKINDIKIKLDDPDR